MKGLAAVVTLGVLLAGEVDGDSGPAGRLRGLDLERHSLLDVVVADS